VFIHSVYPLSLRIMLHNIFDVNSSSQGMLNIFHHVWSGLDAYRDLSVETNQTVNPPLTIPCSIACISTINQALSKCTAARAELHKPNSHHSTSRESPGIHTFLFERRPQTSSSFLGDKKYVDSSNPLNSTFMSAGDGRHTPANTPYPI
jgi:hypothetical protein